MTHVNEPFSQALFDGISAEATVGYLGIVTPDGYPRVVPVNFATIGTQVYFHGAAHGEKHGVLAGGPRVTVAIVVPYAMIPSYWRSPDYACPATQYYKSILIRGRGAIVHEPDEKATALQALMEKHQPEGGFGRLDSADPLYRKGIDDVAIFRIDPDRIDIRTKFGENLTRETRLRIIEKLRECNQGRDADTTLEMEKRLDATRESKEPK
ncbi:MAG: pyridoxamine 5'-phosphate oxidase family protein [Candidatus Zixiibacteriota bacterium]